MSAVAELTGRSEHRPLAHFLQRRIFRFGHGTTPLRQCPQGDVRDEAPAEPLIGYRANRKSSGWITLSVDPRGMPSSRTWRSRGELSVDLHDGHAGALGEMSDFVGDAG